MKYTTTQALLLALMATGAAVQSQPSKPSRKFTDERKAAAQAKRDRKAAKRRAAIKPKTIESQSACKLATEHDHQCHCGTGAPTTHETGTGGCVRFMVPAPIDAGRGRWRTHEGGPVSDFTLREQRGYHQHPCGCWSRWTGSNNSLEFN